MAIILPPEPEFVAGRPNVYGIYHPNVNGWYIGKNFTGKKQYMGSPELEAVKAIEDAHAKVGLPIKEEKRILWSEDGATATQCHAVEQRFIKLFRAEHDGPVFNVFPREDRSNDFRWVHHDPVTHVDRAISSRRSVEYLKLDSRPDAQGLCSGQPASCGQPWGDQVRGTYWCKRLELNGDEVKLYSGPCSSKPYRAFRDDKFKMIHGTENE